MTQTTSSRPSRQPGPSTGGPRRSGRLDQRSSGVASSRGRAVRAAGPGNRWAAVRSAFEGTPGRLRLLGIGTVLACLVLSLAGSTAFFLRQSALSAARADAAQLIRVQEIATQLVKADSLFTNGYLAYGLESTTNRTDYDAAVAEASNLIAEAARAQPADAPRLAEVNDALTQYTARVATARANNNLNYQVAIGYLHQASDLLRGNTKTRATGMLPTLEALMGANNQRVDDAYARSRWATAVLAGTFLLAVGGLVAVQVRLARMTHRYLNLPLVGASATVLLVLAVGAVVMIATQSRANSVYDTSYTQLRKIAAARIDAYTAKSAESISLIYQGTGGDYTTANAQYDRATADTAAKLARIGGIDQLNAWKAAHGKVFEQAASKTPGAWQEAAKAATDVGSAANPTINHTFAAFDGATLALLKDQAQAVDSGLRQGHLPLLLLTWAAVVAGILAAVVGWAGIAQRLEEYR